MPFVLVIIGATFLVAAVRNTQSSLTTLLHGDFTGQGNFLYWLVAIFIIGAVGYVPRFKPFSVAFLVLVILVLLLTRGNPNTTSGGFFTKFSQALGSTTNISQSSSSITSLPLTSV